MLRFPKCGNFGKVSLTATKSFGVILNGRVTAPGIEVEPLIQDCPVHMGPRAPQHLQARVGRRYLFTAADLDRRATVFQSLNPNGAVSVVVQGTSEPKGSI